MYGTLLSGSVINTCFKLDIDRPQLSTNWKKNLEARGDPQPFRLDSGERAEEN